MLALIDQKKLEEAFQLLEEGKETFRSLEGKLGVSRSTLNRWYLSKLEAKIEERKKALMELEGKFSKLQADFNDLEKKYNEKRRLLDEEYATKKASLEQKIESLKKEVEAVGMIFEAQGINFEEGVKIVKEVADLKAEKSKMESYISKLKEEASTWKKLAEKSRLKILRAEEESRGLANAVSSLSRAYYGYLIWLRHYAPLLENYKQQLLRNIKSLEARKASLEAQTSQILDEGCEAVKRLEEEIRLKKAELERLKNECAKVEAEKTGIMGEAKKLLDEMICKAKNERDRLLQEVEQLRKEAEKVKAERSFLESVIKMKLRELKASKPQEDVMPIKRPPF